jgi:hypothetical protein
MPTPSTPSTTYAIVGVEGAAGATETEAEVEGATTGATEADRDAAEENGAVTGTGAGVVGVTGLIFGIFFGDDGEGGTDVAMFTGPEIETDGFRLKAPVNGN